MKITRTRSGKYYNTWTEGDRVHVQDVKTGESKTVSRAQARKDYRAASAKDAREYSNG